MTLKTRQQTARAVAFSLKFSPLDRTLAKQAMDCGNELIERGLKARCYGEDNGEARATRAGDRLLKIGRSMLEVGVALNQAIEIQEHKQA